ncbi:hypothetical protein CEXT_376611 [Caerostris extrusa]|uniref:Uncharacterized protein n=1 Tax=Caerostris extrusa TaxID=172846 RepID=A0AAV4NMU9_CAEEX|nr:hypothetical protein CEXT_376611 [Caerostris extrusa]
MDGKLSSNRARKEKRNTANGFRSIFFRRQPIDYGNKPNILITQLCFFLPRIIPRAETNGGSLSRTPAIRDRKSNNPRW